MILYFLQNMVDFKKKLKEQRASKPISPIDIYDNLDRSTSAAGPLRPVQEEILKDWYENRINERDLIVKLHTGQGKTLIGLLMLQSKLNAGKGPCLYVCPNTQLAQQVAKDAEKFGIQYCMLGKGDKYLPAEFEEGKKILITYVQKVFNGKSVFKLDANGIKVGSFLLDDSHACIDAIRRSYSIDIGRMDPLYKQLMSLFKDSLTQYAIGDYYKIQSSEYEQTVMAVPYWDWVRKSEDVLKLLIDADADNTIFALPLLQNILKYCTMYVTGSKIEITPDYMLTERFTSFSEADCRILMSATTQDDSFFIKGFGFSRDSIENPLTSKSSLWSGEKMILFPTLIDESLTTYRIRNIVGSPAPNRKNGVVVLVPSFWTATEYYRNCVIPNSGDIDNAIKVLGSGNCPDTVVFVNRYDGIDLADNKCRILVLDSLPVFDSLAERFECSCRHGNQMIDVKIAQKIEQGLGRSVRSETDFSVILILGEELVRFIRNSRNQNYFSLQTRSQIALGDQLTEMTKEDAETQKPLNAFYDIIKQCTNRNEDWKDFYKQQMNDLVTNLPSQGIQNVLGTIISESEVEKAVKSNDIQRAIRQLDKLINNCTNDIDRGWYQQQKAKYTFLTSEIEAEAIQYKAHYNNNYLFIPQNYQYRKLGSVNVSRLDSIKKILSSFDDFKDLKLYVDEMLANMTFGVSADKFEESIKQLGLFLGFESQRPDLEYKKGPDNLWRSANGTFFLIECKNEVSLSRKTISKDEAGQMCNHINWFNNQYPGSSSTNIWIHPTNELDQLADINEIVFVITPAKLDQLKTQVLKYCGEFSAVDLKTISDDFLLKLLKQYNFVEKTFANVYCVPLKRMA